MIPIRIKWPTMDRSIRTGTAIEVVSDGGTTKFLVRTDDMRFVTVTVTICEEVEADAEFPS